MKKLIPIISTCLLISIVSCQKKDRIENYVTLEETIILQATGNEKISGYEITSTFETFKLDKSLKIKEDTSINLNPFKDYLNRDFYTDGVASKYFLQEVPGHLFRKEDNGDLTKVSIKRLVKNNGYPAVEVVDEEYYNNKITDRKSLNAAASIINLGIAQNEVVELILRDEIVSILPDSLFNEAMIKELSKKIENDLENYYLAKGAVVSSVISKIFKENKFSKKINAGWLTSDGETYNSLDNFRMRKDISLELISLKDYLLIFGP